MLRRALLSLLLLLPLLAQAGGRMGSHGMVLFGGRDTLYASHLPMFHAPHDVQLVLRLHIEDSSIDRSLRTMLDGRTELWTIDPAPFALDDVKPGMRFQAQIVAGHFERGGKARWHDAGIVVDEVILRRELSPAMQTRDQAVYVRVGSFLVKEIDSRPDFDHIVALEKPSGMGRITVPKFGLVQTDPRTLQTAAGVRVRGTVYFDTADLR